MINKIIINKIFKDFINNRKKTNRMIGFCIRLYPTLLNTGTQIWLCNNMEKRLPQTHWKNQLIFIKV